MKQLVVVLCFICLSRAFAFVTDYAIQSPMRGWAAKPGKEHVFISLYYQQLCTSSAFSSSSDKLSLKDYIGISNVDPAIKKNVAYADISLGLTPTFGVQVIVPFVSGYRLSDNSDAGFAKADINGDSGFGDVDLGVWFNPKPFQNMRFVFSGLYHITSGTSPYEVSTADGIFGSNQPLSTGLGYSYLSFSAKSDVHLIGGLSASFSLGYQYNRYFIQNGYEPTSKMGDIFSAAARVHYTKSFLSFSLTTQYAGSFDDIESGYSRRDTGQSLLSMLPQLGISAPRIPFLQVIHFGFVTPLAGKNIIFPDYVFVGVDFEF